MKTRKSVINSIVILAGIIILLNLLSNRFFMRLDFTEDKRYTLSDATKGILSDLDDPVTVSAYFTKNMPVHVARVKDEFKDLLVEYMSRSGGNVVYEFIDPNEDPKVEQEINQKGISPVMINVREKDQVKQQKAYMGAVLRFGDKTEIIPFMQPGAAMEYSLSTAIKKLSVRNREKICFIQGHGESPMRAYQQVMASLNVLYDIEEVYLNDTTDLSGFKTVVLGAPADTIPEEHFRVLDRYLATGGNLMITMNRVNGDMSTAMGSEVTTGLEAWLNNIGVVVNADFVVDAKCANVTVRQQQGIFTFNSQVKFPYLPIVSTFADHSVTKGLESVVLHFASSITFTGDTTVSFTPLVKSSKNAGTLATPLYFNIQKEWGKSDFPISDVTMGAVIEGKIQGDVSSKIVLFSDGDFAVNGLGQGAQQQQPDNVNLFVNSIDWLSDDTGLINLRTKGVTSRPIEQVEDATKALIKWLNFILPIILIIVYGMIHAHRNRIIRLKRMEESYV